MAVSRGIRTRCFAPSFTRPTADGSGLDPLPCSGISLSLLNYYLVLRWSQTTLNVFRFCAIE